MTGAMPPVLCHVIKYNQCTTQHPELSVFLLSSMSLKLHITLERLDDIQRLPTYIRLAKLLLQHTDKQGRVALRQKDLADQLGIKVLSCHQSIKKLAELALIKTSYGAINFKNVPSLTLWLKQKMSLGRLLKS